MRVKTKTTVTLEMNEIEANFLYGILENVDPKGSAEIEDAIDLMLNALSVVVDQPIEDKHSSVL